MSNISEASSSLRKLIGDFLQDRLAEKIDKLAHDDPKRHELMAEFELEAWVENAAKDVGQLQIVTHSLKPIHPNAKGTNLYISPDSLPRHQLVGSHTLGEIFSVDAVGNAAALAIYKFLKLEQDGKSILQRAQESDDELAAALSCNLENSRKWMEAFAKITEQRGINASHTRAKQVYWLAGEDPTRDSDYHLLAPLYATSLAHTVFQIINKDRFGEKAKEARQARRNGVYSEFNCREYSGMAVQKLGGTKPQNISQLNSERRGANYLLSSLPPGWKSSKVREPFYSDSAFSYFERRADVRRILHELKRLLQLNSHKNMKVRELRDDYVGVMIDELMLFSAELRTLKPGWSASSKCQLPDAEQLWLDPDRGEKDVDFSLRYKSKNWAGEICHLFGRWLNLKLGDVLPVADNEYSYWVAILKKNIDALQEAL